MKILITGGGGYLGSVLVPMLLLNGHKVTVVDTFVHGIPSLLHVATNPDLKILCVDAVDVKQYGSDIRQADIIIPLAAIVGAKACDEQPEQATAVNSQQIKSIRNLMGNEQRMIFPCTNSGYGIGGELLCTEDQPLRPLTHYGVTKVAGEKYALDHPHTISLRFATLFGCSPRMRNDLLVNSFALDAILGTITVYEGAYRRNFLHVHDAARAIIHAIYSSIYSSTRGIFNVGDDRANMTKLELAQHIATCHVCNIIEGEGKDPDQRDYIVSSAKFYYIGYEPAFSFDQGVNELLQAYATMPLIVAHRRRIGYKLLREK